MDEYDLKIRELQDDLGLDEKSVRVYNAIQYLSVSEVQREKLRLDVLERGSKKIKMDEKEKFSLSSCLGYACDQAGNFLAKGDFVMVGQIRKNVIQYLGFVGETYDCDVANDAMKYIQCCSWDKPAAVDRSKREFARILKGRVLCPLI